MKQSRSGGQKTIRQKRVRWYMGFKQTTGRGGYKPSQVIEIITDQVQRHNLSQYIPLLRIEKNPRGEYCFFLAIESELQGKIPAPIENSNILKLRLFEVPARKKGDIFTFEDIKSMVGAAHRVHDYTNPIPYRSQPRNTPESPLALTNSTNTQNLDEKVIRELSEKYEHLLYWLSASGKGTWQSFRKICEVLELPEPKRILRRLKLLGHLTTSDNGSKWQAKPPSLLLLQSDIGTGNRTYLLHGQRSHLFINKLQMFGNISIKMQPRGEAPYCTYLTLPDKIAPEVLQERMKAHGYHITFSKLPEIPNLDDWRNSLPTLQGVLTSRYGLRQFNGEEFIDCVFQNQTGFYQFYAQDSAQRLICSLFYDQNSNSWLQGDWYGLRFLAILSMGTNPNVYYHKEQEELSVPLAQRLPEIYEAYLVMQSGQLPTYTNGYLCYRHINEQKARKLAESLRFELMEE